MTAAPPERHARARRLGPFFDVQLRLAAHVAARTGRPIGEAALRLTNFHRRFGFGDPDAARDPRWDDYASRLDACDTIEAQVAWTQAFFLAAPEEPLAAGPLLFGCFSCEPPDEAGIVRIHFNNRDYGAAGPLHRSRIAARRAEIAAMAAHLRDRHPQARTIRGTSWLYNIPAYRRLFPDAYARSARPAEWLRLSGMSSWGQFLAHDETIKPALRDAFLHGLADLDPAAPWRSFPLPAMIAEAPLEAFLADDG